MEGGVFRGRRVFWFWFLVLGEFFLLGFGGILSFIFGEDANAIESSIRGNLRKRGFDEALSRGSLFGSGKWRLSVVDSEVGWMIDIC